MQDTLLRAIEKADSYQPGTNMRAWLFTIMRNKFYTDVKKSARERTGSSDCASPMVVDTSKTEVQNGCIYVIAVGEDLLVKRVRRRLDGLIDLISDNVAYPPETLARDRLTHLRVIGRVYGAVSKF